jgi:hypothetical protein
MSWTFARLAWVLSLIVCITITALWFRSYRRCDVWVRQEKPGDRWCVTSEFGTLVFEKETAPTPPPQRGWVYFVCPLPRRFPARRLYLGFDCYRDANRHYVFASGTPLAGLCVPYWFLASITSLPFAKSVRRRWRRREVQRRLQSGLCPTCGYDVRASRARCSECGTPLALV